MKTFKQILKEQEQYKSGDTWETKPGIWAGKNPDGEIEYYSGGNAKQKAQEERERIEKETKATQEQTEKIVHKAKQKAKGLVKKGKKKK